MVSTQLNQPAFFLKLLHPRIQYLESIRPSFIYCLEDDLAEQTDQHVDGIRECFQDWVSEIDVTFAERKLSFAENAKFLTFNYTSTLQVVYGFSDKQVLHIHGKAEAFDDLIFGHGDTMEDEAGIDEYGEGNRTPFSDSEGAAKYPFYALQKPVETILGTHENFFESLGQINEIVVIGHSLNKIDRPYFARVAEKAPAARWTVCCFTVADEVNHVQAVVQCGVLRKQIRLCSYSDLGAGYIQPGT